MFNNLFVKKHKINKLKITKIKKVLYYLHKIFNNKIKFNKNKNRT